VNIRTARLEESVAFYRDVIGLSSGPAATRPDSPNHIWMSDKDGSPCVHLQKIQGELHVAEEHIGVHHVALSASQPEEWRRKLKSMAVDFDEFEFAHARMLQFNLRDPNGVRLELLFGAE
jgi:catechol 2,3-dioxygenase-like lactoylglutathione lyase family enzyme